MKSSTHPCFKPLVNLASGWAHSRLQQGAALQPAFLFVNGSLFGNACPGPDDSAHWFQHFVDALRLLAVARNVEAAVLLDLLERVSTPTESPVNAPADSAKQYVLLAWQSRNDALTFVIPVHRNADGTFSHLGQMIQAQHLPWLADIVPAKESDENERTTAEILLQGHNVIIDM